MPDRWAMALAAASFGGALVVVDGHAPGAPLPVALVALALGWLAARAPSCGPAGPPRRPVALCLGAGLLASALAARSLAGLDAPPATGPVATEVVLVGDPVPDGRGGVRVDVRLGGRRLRAAARTAAAAALDDRLAGERVSVIGEVRPPGAYERRLRHRHLAGRLTVETVVGWRSGEGITRLANGLRRTLAEGAAVLPGRRASLLAGITLGDDRHQPADMTDAFRAAGLTHLLAVSGQNVAFVMVIAAPVLARLRFGPRLATTLAVLAFFALVTRAEPSVLRAVAMTSVAAVGAALGRPTSTARTLALGVAAMVLVDPLLAASVGFKLSVAGAAGIVAGAARIEAALPGPRWLAAPLSVTMAAQAAVSPLLVTTFGAVPLASLPANLLAGPAAGPLMVWGLSGGLLAGLAGETVARLVHLPNGALLAWIDGVAAAGARWPLGDLGPGHLAALAAGATMLAAGRALRARAGRALGPAGCALGGAVMVAALGAAAVAPAAAPAEGGRRLGAGATLWHGGGATVLAMDGQAREHTVLRGLREARARRVDLVVLRTHAAGASDVVATLRRSYPVGLVLVPAGRPSRAGGRDGAAGGVSPRAGTVLDVGDLRLRVVANAGGRLEVEVRARSPATVRTRGGGVAAAYPRPS